MIHEERISKLNEKSILDNPYVIYWMQCSQRTKCNHALEYAISKANDLNKPLIVYFGLTEGFPEANERHYRFMLEGLKEVKHDLSERGIRFLVVKGSPEKGAILLSRRAALLVVDRGYLRIERQWRKAVGENAQCAVVQVETNVVVPVEVVSSKEEYAAATIRGKLNQKLDAFTAPLEERKCRVPSIHLEKVAPFDEIDVDDVAAVMDGMPIDGSVKAVSGFIGGTSHGERHLEEFILHRLSHYSDLKNEPGLDYSSNLSPYLHFGQISPLAIYRRLLEVDLTGKKDFLEELIVRRELSMNFVHYNPEYDSYRCIPPWARETLEKHRGDGRDFCYTREELEGAMTHDQYWNAAQKEMVLTGKMHGYMRMYWGKKLLEWSRSPEEAYETAICLNNRYSLDGRDPNAFTGVAWCFGKHDRPWGERAIFGMVRYMNDKGLKRKFDMDRYLRKVDALSGGGIQMSFF